jgi:pilus assembly protein CpaB
MKPKTMMLMVVAIGCGLAASYMTSKLLAERNTTPSEEAKVMVVMAKQKVPAWAPIKDPDKYFEEKEVPESLAPKKSVKELSKLKDQRLSQPLSEGDYVLEDKLVNPDQVGLIAKLPPGMRAIALKVNAESLAGGFVLPGYRVDVVSTTRGNDSVSKIILQNMLVLAVDMVAQRDHQTTAMLGSTVTLAATPEEAQRLSLASALGELRLTLRSPEDNKIVHLPGSRWEDLGKPVHDNLSGKEDDAPPVVSAPPVPPLPPLPKDAPPPITVAEKPPEKKPEPAPAPPPPETHTMTIISGEYTQKAVFTLDPVNKVWTNGSLGNNAEDAPPRRVVPPPSSPAAPSGAKGKGEGADAPPAPPPADEGLRGRIG